MVVRRIKDRWHNSTPDDPSREVLTEKSLDDQASALSFIIWRQALNGAINLHAEDFRYDDDRQRIGVISELLAFQIQLVDRLSHGFLEDTQRASLLNSLCLRIAEHVQENMTDIAGPGQYQQPFIALLNRRFTEYAQFNYSGNNPGYDVLRYLGRQVLDIMGEDQTNRWIMDQVIDIDAPALVKQIDRSVTRLFGLDQSDSGSG
ncbi:MAG: hypothetical protein KTR32_29455 [Granulosicoccus sp.]|nr:hypothetical protein [Granulosicoccus sp.]